jgi:pSer/pThr/pTyr-binding forkhead associated (FHA) protein
MAKLVLQFEGRVLSENAVAATLTIGRLPGNTVVIDNPAVSGMHARVVCEGAQFVVEDLDSRNGTFVNEKRVTRHVLQHGDVLFVGKHRLVFDGLSGDAPVVEEAGALAMPDLGGTVVLDTEQQRKLLAAVQARLQARNGSPGGAGRQNGAHAESGRLPTGVLRVVEGRADRAEYRLEGETTLIGKSDTALVRLKGWFKPRVAVAIARMGEGYAATLHGGRTLINGQRLKGRRGLEHGDRLEVSGLTLEFRIEG